MDRLLTVNSLAFDLQVNLVLFRSTHLNELKVQNYDMPSLLRTSSASFTYVAVTTIVTKTIIHLLSN